MRYFIIAFAVLLGVSPLFAQSDGFNKFVEENSPNWCRNIDFASQSQDYWNGKIKAKTRLLKDDDDEGDACPSEDVKLCPLNETINANVSVVVSKKFRNFYCVYNPRNSLSGWVSEKNLTITPKKEIQISDWIGKWVDGPNEIEIKSDESGLSDEAGLNVMGQALWIGEKLKNGRRPVNSGGVDFIGQPQQNKLTYLAKEENNCGIELINLGSYLIVRDNSHCGGLNVRFNGVYKRKKTF